MGNWNDGIKFLTTILIACLTYLNGFNTFGQHIKVEKVPSWVLPVKHTYESQVSKYDVQSGVYYKLIDYQINSLQESVYSHYVQNIVSSGGVSNASQIQITYDSSFQSIKLHKVIIWRNNKALDKTDHTKFEYVKNEQSLQTNIYSGDVTALAILDDLRKNDLLEMSYTVVGNNPVYDGTKYHQIPLEDINPVDKLYVRVKYPSDSGYAFQCHGCDEDSVEVSEEKGGSTVLTIEKNNLEAVQLENTIPSWIIPYKYLEVSSTNSWKDVNDWALDIFAQDDDDKVDNTLSEICYEDFSQDDKINAIIDFVQDEIRYMGIESGMGSIKPFTPNQTLAQRFGDCKDKALLLTTMLERIGIEKSFPALVNSSTQHNIEQFLPSGHIFDHVIVCFELNGKQYWLDPSNPFQGGTYKDIDTFDYGKALIVSEETTGLSDLAGVTNNSKLIINERYDISSFDSVSTINVISEMYGARADYTRQVLEYYSKKELAESYKYVYGLLFPSLVESKKLKIKDDELNNNLTTEENYEISGSWTDNREGYPGQWVLMYEPVGLGDYLFQINCEPRNYPVMINHPANYSQRTIFKLPQILYLDTTTIRYDNEAFTFEKKINYLNATTVQIDYSFVSKVKELSRHGFDQYCQHMNEILNGISVIFSYPKFNYQATSALDFANNNQFLRNSSQANLNNYINQKIKLNSYIPDSQLNEDNGFDIGQYNLESTDAGNSVVVDEQPAYPKGMAGFYKKIKKLMVYPRQAKRMKIEGRVYVSFTVTEAGEITNIQVVKGIGAGCDEEAARLIKEAGKWIPGKLDGKAVDVRMILPIIFKLKYS